ncbi:hypothetical protein HMPREF1146_2629 [Prevotella sp. MSX73]|nr:hypothetical protein HMPREF1146_2629 [Prevotella sp. MSX73]
MIFLLYIVVWQCFFLVNAAEVLCHRHSGERKMECVQFCASEYPEFVTLLPSLLTLRPFSTICGQIL